MAAKFVVLAVCVAMAKAGGVYAPVATPLAAPIAAAHLAYAAPAPLAYAAPIAKTVAVAHEEYDPNPQYSYGYDVQDALTGDSKNQYETRNGDVVQGSYSLTDADGTRRTVEYVADPINGFNAVVHKEPLALKAVAAAPAVAAYAAPVARFSAAPLAYAAPIAKVAAPLAYAAPITRFGSPLAYSTSVLH